MRFTYRSTVIAAVLMALATSASAQMIRAEYVTGGALDESWIVGFGLSNAVTPRTMVFGDPAYSNPSGDHTVLVATNTDQENGGLALSCVTAAGYSDYSWKANIFTGNGDSRRGIIVRANPDNNYQSCYQLVIEQGLLTVRFRKLVNGTPTTLATWFTTPATQTWRSLEVRAVGSSFRCFLDGVELTTSPIVDTDLPTGDAGVYNFRFDIGGIEFLVDDLELEALHTVAVQSTTWGKVKSLYR